MGIEPQKSSGLFPTETINRRKSKMYITFGFIMYRHSNESVFSVDHYHSITLKSIDLCYSGQSNKSLNLEEYISWFAYILRKWSFIENCSARKSSSNRKSSSISIDILFEFVLNLSDLRHFHWGIVATISSGPVFLWSLYSARMKIHALSFSPPSMSLNGCQHLDKSSFPARFPIH